MFDIDERAHDRHREALPDDHDRIDWDDDPSLPADDPDDPDPQPARGGPLVRDLHRLLSSLDGALWFG